MPAKRIRRFETLLMTSPAKELQKELRCGNVDAHRYFDCPHYQKCLVERARSTGSVFHAAIVQSSGNIRKCRVPPSHASYMASVPEET